MAESEWQPHPVDWLEADEFMVIEASLTGKPTLQKGDTVRLRVNWVAFGDIRLTPEKATMIRIKVV